MKWNYPNFSASEFECECCGEERMDKGFIDLLQMARTLADIPFNVNSGWRCVEHNAMVGGVISSSHLLGYAADIAAVTPWERMVIIRKLYEAAEMALRAINDDWDEQPIFPRIIIYPKRGFIHIDVDPDKPQGAWIDIDGTRY